jgi:hypothetical protein
LFWVLFVLSSLSFSLSLSLEKFSNEVGSCMHGMINVGPPPPPPLEKKRARRKMDEKVRIL